MKVVLPFLIVLIFSCSNTKKSKDTGTHFASDFEKYDALKWSAMVHFNEGEYDKSLANFLDAFEILSDEEVSDYFYAATSALHLQKDQLAKELIIKAIVKTNAAEHYFDSFDRFNEFRNKPLFTEIKQEYSNYQSAFFESLKSPAIYKETDSLNKLDQKIRSNGSSLDEISRVDTANIKRLIQITKTHGWQDKGWLLLWHQRGTYGEQNYVWDFFKPYIDTQIKQGNMRKDFWAFFDEEKSVREKNEQIYGLFTSNYKEFPIKNIEIVDSLRAEIGKPTLLYEHEIYGIELPRGYQAKTPLTAYKNY
ncbi:MAG: hypothetical protein CMC70_01515 [Flavobacteriaceae bacterium]|nr:hypothetical protein [Flavobacteriaceae bacterium]